MPDRDFEHPQRASSDAPPRPGAMLIARRALLTSEAFGAALSPGRVGAAIARGLRAGGLPEPDLCPLAPAVDEPPKELLDAVGFDARMLSSHAVIIAVACLSEQTLTASVAFEIATRARQSGVPAYAVTAANELDAFDARILDLQLILEASSARALGAAGRRLARVL
jgi:glycerate 2-kinase